MSETLLALTAPDLIPIVQEIHDWWFRIEDAQVVVNGVVTIRLSARNPYKGKSSKPTKRLKISNVLHVELQDTAKVGAYDINEMKFDPSVRLLTITTGIPLTLAFRLDAFRLELINLGGEGTNP